MDKCAPACLCKNSLVPEAPVEPTVLRGWQLMTHRPYWSTASWETQIPLLSKQTPASSWTTERGWKAPLLILVQAAVGLGGSRAGSLNCISASRGSDRRESIVRSLLRSVSDRSLLPQWEMIPFHFKKKKITVLFFLIIDSASLGNSEKEIDDHQAIQITTDITAVYFWPGFSSLQISVHSHTWVKLKNESFYLHFPTPMLALYCEHFLTP